MMAESDRKKGRGMDTYPYPREVWGRPPPVGYVLAKGDDTGARVVLYPLWCFTVGYALCSVVAKLLPLPAKPFLRKSHIRLNGHLSVIADCRGRALAQPQ